jgi:chromosome condensin MukBEF complex kleisin-like MukF subunit
MSETLALDWKLRAENCELRLEETATKLAALQDAAFDLLSALEGQHIDEIVRAKRRMGLVLIDM